MWVRQCDLDAGAEALPISSRIASNEEFIPPPQTREQKQYEARLKQISDKAAKKQGMKRRDFLRTGSGMAAALVALNEVFGPCYEVSAAEVQDQQASPRNGPRTSSYSTCKRTMWTFPASGTKTRPEAGGPPCFSGCCGPRRAT